MKFSHDYFNLNWLIFTSIILGLVYLDFLFLLSIPVLVAVQIYRILIQDELPELSIKKVIPKESYHTRDKIDISVEIFNPTDKIFRGEIIDLFPKFGQITEGINFIQCILFPQERVILSYSLVLPISKIYEIPETIIYSHDAGELHENIQSQRVTNKIILLPYPINFTTSPFVAKYLRSIGSPFTSRLTGEGWNFTSIREYDSSDSLRRINWKATAKYQKLHTNEFQIDRPSKIIIVLDLTGTEVGLLDLMKKTLMGLITFFMNTSSRTGLLVINDVMVYHKPTVNREVLRYISQDFAKLNKTTITNFNIFKQRLDVVRSKVESDHEVLLFSSLTDLWTADIVLDTLQRFGRVNLFLPIYDNFGYTTDINKPDEYLASVFQKAKSSIETKKVIEKGIKVIPWDPTIGLERSIILMNKRVDT